MVRIKLTRDGQEYIFDYDEVEEVSQNLGDIQRLYDFCNGWFQCPSCAEKGEGIQCGKRFQSGIVRGDPEPIEVTFKDGRIELFDKYERLDVKEITST